MTTDTAPPRTRLYVANDPTLLRICPELAVEIGLAESILLMQIDFWITSADNERDGRWWTYQSTRKMQRDAFPFWSLDTINRAVQSLEEQQLIFVGRYNQHTYDHTRWFALNPEGIAKLSSVKLGPYENRTAPSGNRTRKTQNRTGSTQDRTTIPETTTDTTAVEKEKTPTPPPPLYDLALALSEVCGMQLDLNKARIFGEAKKLHGATPTDLREHYGAGGWWYRSDWRGKKGQRPALAQVRETWGRWASEPPSSNGRSPESYTDSGAEEFDARMAAAASESEAARVWRLALVQLQAQMTRATYSAQLHGSTAVALSGDDTSCTLTVALASETARGWVEAKMRAKVEAAVSAAAGRPAKVAYVVRESAS